MGREGLAGTPGHGYGHARASLPHLHSGDRDGSELPRLGSHPEQAGAWGQGHVFYSTQPAPGPLSL